MVLNRFLLDILVGEISDLKLLRIFNLDELLSIVNSLGPPLERRKVFLDGEVDFSTRMLKMSRVDLLYVFFYTLANEGLPFISNEF